MRYILREGLFGPGEPYEIANQHGWRPLVAVPSDPWRDVLVLYDRAGIERATLSLWAAPAGAMYRVTRGGRLLAVVARGGLLERGLRVYLDDEREARAHAVGHGAYRLALRGDTLAAVSAHGPGCYAVEVDTDHLAVPVVLACCVALEALAAQRARRAA